MIQGILIGLIAMFAVIFIRGLRSGSSFIYSRYMDSNVKRRGPRGFGRTGEKESFEKGVGWGAPVNVTKQVKSL